MQEITADSLLTSHQAGTILQVNPSSINKWVKEGRIPAFRTPGGHRRIKASDLVDFLTKYDMPIPQNLMSATKRRVLIADADTHQLENITTMLKPWGSRIEIHSTNNGMDAMMMVGAIKPHLVILDTQSTDIDGMSLCRRLKDNELSNGTKIVLTCSNLTDDIKSRGMSAGAVHTVNKPIDISMLLSELDIPETTAHLAN
ncbi:response regulator [Myxococcota bacterium]|nr:response regulator [Myxococcota bacterium]